MTKRIIRAAGRRRNPEEIPTVAGEISAAEYRARRDRVMAELADGVGLLFAGDASASLHGKFEADANFVYLTGLRDEPGAVILLDPRAENPRRRSMLFLKPRDPDLEVWDGYRDSLSERLETKYGFDSVTRTTSLPRFLTHALRLRRKAVCLHPFSSYNAPVSEDLAMFRKVAERVLGVTITEKAQLLAEMRSIKSTSELSLMRKAAVATARGYDAVISVIRNGATERDVQLTLEAAFLAGGASGTAYNTIAGAGLNSTVLHYHANNQPLHDGDLLCIDAGAAYGGYACDVTRTYPVSGRFSPEQREVYQLVLKAQTAAIKAIRPGVHFFEVENMVRDMFRAAGLLDYFPHGLGHHLGLYVHDATPDGPLREGMVVTIEPGLYIPDRRIGIRIEDDVLVTKRGSEVLTAAIPKEADEIEQLFSR